MGEIQYGFCFLKAVPLRREPDDRAEMVSQLLYGDGVVVIERQEKWSRVRCAYDGYEGWVDNKQWLPVPDIDHLDDDILFAVSF